MSSNNMSPDEWQTVRVKIANLVARKKELDRVCCICGGKGKILHNKENPYRISFICDECRKSPENVIEATKHRFDLRTKLSKDSLHISTFTEKDIIKLIDGYLNMNISIGEYCKKRGISRYQFSKLLDKYDLALPEMQVKIKVKEKSNLIMAEKAINKKKGVV